MINKTYNWKTASVIRETDDALTIVFENEGDAFSYKPGQFINLKQTINRETVYRSYSLSSSPLEDKKPSVTIKKIDGGIMSNHIFHHAETIAQWEVEGPFGNFFADPQFTGNKPIVLIGGGSGITPLFSILKTFLKQSSAKISLINCNRSWNDVIFAKDLNQLEHLYTDRLEIHHFLSRENERTEIPCKNFRKEKVTRLVLKKLLKKLLLEEIVEAEYFICGPDGVIQLSEEVLQALAIPASQIHKEQFSPTSKDTTIELPQTSKEVLLHYYEQTNLLQVQPGKTILDAALEDRIPLRYSCKDGTCGTCAALRTSGKLHMAKNFALSKEEVDKGYVLLCQSHPLNDDVTVVIE